MKGALHALVNKSIAKNIKAGDLYNLTFCGLCVRGILSYEMGQVSVQQSARVFWSANVFCVYRKYLIIRV
jgi:hypothetical protein